MARDLRARRRSSSTSTRRRSCARCCSTRLEHLDARRAPGQDRAFDRRRRARRGSRTSTRCRRRSSSTARSPSSSRPTSTRCRRSSIRRTGRLHTSFNQTVAATGRLSSLDPNLQNIPMRTEEGRRIRAAFVAAPGMPADLRRLLADRAPGAGAPAPNDPALIEAFARGEDIHARTAREVFGRAARRPRDAGWRRSSTSASSTAWAPAPCGARARRLARRGRDVHRAATSRATPGVRQLHRARPSPTARERGFVTTVLGRRRYLPELGARDPAVRQFAERAAVNTPIQGSAADLIKLAMLEVSRRLARGRPAGARMLLQVHDELVLEAPEAEVGRRRGPGADRDGGGLAPAGSAAGRRARRARIGRRSTGDERRALNTIGAVAV